jgi:hypothetical protein
MSDIADKIYAATGLTLNAEAAAAIGQMIQQARRDALEEAARWHDEKEKLVQEKAREVSEFSLSIGLDLFVKAGDHRRCAAEIRALGEKE